MFDDLAAVFVDAVGWIVRVGAFDELRELASGCSQPFDLGVDLVELPMIIDV